MQKNAKYYKQCENGLVRCYFRATIVLSNWMPDVGTRFCPNIIQL